MGPSVPGELSRGGALRPETGPSYGSRVVADGHGVLPSEAALPNQPHLPRVGGSKATQGPSWRRCKSQFSKISQETWARIGQKLTNGSKNDSSDTPTKGLTWTAGNTLEK